MPVPTLAEKVVATAIGEVGAKEVGTNSGRRVKGYLASCGLEEGAPWCACFMHWCFRESDKIIEPHKDFALAAKWATKGEVFRKGQEDMYWSGELGHPFQRISMNGDTFTLFYSSLRRIGHVGMVIGEDEDYLTTIEGNTNSGGDREGEGVFKRKRLKSTIHTINRWTE